MHEDKPVNHLANLLSEFGPIGKSMVAEFAVAIRMHRCRKDGHAIRTQRSDQEIGSIGPFPGSRTAHNPAHNFIGAGPGLCAQLLAYLDRYTMGVTGGLAARLRNIATPSFPRDAGQWLVDLADAKKALEGLLDPMPSLRVALEKCDTYTKVWYKYGCVPHFEKLKERMGSLAI